MCEEVVGAVALGTVEKGAGHRRNWSRAALRAATNAAIASRFNQSARHELYRYKARPGISRATDTVRPHCGTGCQLTVGTRKGEFMRVRLPAGRGLNGETPAVKAFRP